MSDYPECPKCGWQDMESYFEYHDGSEAECPECGTVFIIRVIHTTEYESEEKVKK